jgi:hypothetical protein
MQKIFQHIRKQPKQVRENYAFAVAAVFTSAVLLVWIVSRPQTGFFGEISGQVSQTATPFATLVKESKEQLAQLKGAVATTTAQLETSAPETATSATALVLTPEDIFIANTAAINESTTTESKAYVEVMIGTSSAALAPNQNTATSAAETAQ